MVCAYLDPDTNYVAQTQELSADYFGETFEGVLFMHNSAPSQSYPVICALKVTQTTPQGQIWVMIGTRRDFHVRVYDNNFGGSTVRSLEGCCP